jgi:hypothetical protein
MSYRLLTFLTTIGIIFSSCSRGQEQYGEKYAVTVSYKDTTNRLKSNGAERKIEQNKLYLFFEVYYSNDTISIKTNLDEKSKTIYLTTNPVIDVADVVVFDNLETIKWIEIRKNKGTPLKFQVKEKWMNKWAVNYFKDTLRACPLNFAPFYD